MSDPEVPQPNPNVAKIEAGAKSAWHWAHDWSHVHTVATAAILGFLSGWLLPKIVGWFL